MRVDQTVLSVLGNSTVAGRLLSLPEQLDRKLYMSVAKALEAAGWKWNRKLKGHECTEEDGVAKLEQLLLTGEVTHMRQEFDLFETPERVVEQMIEHALIPDQTDIHDPKKVMKVLEPSAGRGRIVKAVRKTGAIVFAYEVQKPLADLVTTYMYPQGACCCKNFLEVEPNPVFDRVLMNPPFSKQADIAHVTHALKFVRPGGMLISIMSPSFTFRTDRKTTAFKELLDSCDLYEITVLPTGTFKESGTMVSTLMLKVIP